MSVIFLCSVISITCVPSSKDLVVKGLISITCVPSSKDLVVSGLISITCVLSNKDLVVKGLISITCVPSSKDLVVSGLISADEFWVNRLGKEQGVGGVSDHQETGLPSAFLVRHSLSLLMLGVTTNNNNH